MLFVENSVEIVNKDNWLEIELNKIEKAARICYNSEPNINTRDNFIRKIIQSGHESVLEHGSVSFIVICDRSTSHQIVRHRIGCSYSQESQRYVDYSKDKNGAGLKFIYNQNINPGWDKNKLMNYLNDVEREYLELIKLNKAEDARMILPNCTATRIFITMNFRAIRHFLQLRLDKHAQKSIREIATMLYKTLNINNNPILEGINIE